MNYEVFDCLSEKTPIEGQKLLEASAGTGKTFAIEHITARLLLTGISIKEILVVTFTNLATEELKERILANLSICCAFLKEKNLEGAFPYLKQYFESEESLNNAITNLQSAILCFDEANVYTIHSFCKKSLQEYFFEAESIFSSSSTQFKCEKQIMKKKLKMILLDPKLKEIFFSSSFHYFLKNKNIDSSLDKIAGYLSNNFRSNSFQYIPINEILGEVKVFFEEKGFINLDYNLLLHDFHLNAKNYKKTKFSKEDFEEQLKILSEISFDFFNFKAWDKLLFHKFSIAEFFSNENSKLKLKEVSGENFASFFQFLNLKVYPKIKLFFDPKYFLDSLTYHFRDVFINQIDKTDSILADRLLEMMEASLSNVAFLKAIKKKYKAAIIDEFQDTDRTQWDIFLKVFLKDPKIPFFYLVGDPKQAIYAFRNADVYTYLEASSFLGEKNTYLLDTNYRSKKSLVEGLNALFDRRWLYLPKLNDVLKYYPVKSHDKSDTIAPIHYMIADSCESSDIESEMFYPFILNEIKKMGEPYSKYAILVKDRFQEQKLQNFLFMNNIPCNARKKALHVTSAYQCLKQIIQAIFEPNDLSNLKLLMISLNYSFDEIEDERIVNAILADFNQLHMIFKNIGISACLSKLIDFSFHGLTLLERLVQKDSFAAADFTDTLDLLLDYGMKNHLSENSIDIFYQMVEKNEFQRQSLSSSDAVQILTIHKSKGLEFEVVFCLGVAFSNSSKLLKTQNFKEIEAEKLRQLYVAFTRAKSLLFIPIVISSKTAKELSPVDLLLHNLLGSQQVIDISILQKLFEEIHTSNQYQITILEKQAKNYSSKKEMFLENFLNSYPKQKSNSQFLSFTAVSNPYPMEKKLEECDSFPIGPLTGVIIHKILEDLFSQKNKKIKLTRYLENSPLAEFESQIEVMIKRLLLAPLSPFLFSLSDIDFKKSQTELEFCYMSDQNKMKGFVDLIFCHQDKFFIIDWKTNFLGNDDSCYEMENLKKIMIQHDYLLQGAIYVNALKKSLKIFGERCFEEKFGGVFFIFLRGLRSKGNGLFHYFPSPDLIERAKF